MPWSRLRTPRPGDATGPPRRQSTIDPLASPEHHEQSSNSSTLRLGHDPLDSVKTPSPLRNSFEPSAVEQAASSIERSQDPMLPEQPQKRQRFSMLKYRHASDPQVRFSILHTLQYPEAEGRLIRLPYDRYPRQPEIMDSHLCRLCQQVRPRIGGRFSMKTTVALISGL